MNGLKFFDTNILVYADDASSPRKQRIDRAIDCRAFGAFARPGKIFQ
jgi:hypothetical protein